MRNAEIPVTVCFAGNPNCGKTTLFNALTGAGRKVGNWPGVTVERIEGTISRSGKKLRLFDTPGIYSLTSYTIEEQVTRRCLADDDVDVIVNVADALLLERSLYLTLQLLELKKPVILVLNLMDLADERGIVIDCARLSAMLAHIPVIPVSAKKRTGLDALLDAALACGKTGQMRPVFGESPYNYVEKIIKNCISGGKEEKSGVENESLTDRADRILAHGIWGVPIFFCIMALVFFLTFTVGDFLKGYLEAAIGLILKNVQIVMESAGTAPWLISLVTDGVFAGVGGILSFLPNLAILFLALAILEDSGYMARIAWLMDEMMGLAGLSGKAFLPMLLGFGCSVPAILAARTLENEKDRKKTIAAVPYMSCSARLPIYVLFSGMFFKENAAAAAYSMYVVGIAAAVAAAAILHLADGGDGAESALLIELPEYRTPDAGTVFLSVWERVREYLRKAGTTIFLASVVLWFFMNTGPKGLADQASESFAAYIGTFLVPVLKPAGLGTWQTAVALISGISAKEVVVSSFAVLYGIAGINSPAGMAELERKLAETGFTAVNAYALMVFCLLYTPCAAAIAAVRKETCSLKFTVRMIIFQLLSAWAAAVFVYQAGSLIY